MVIAPTEKTNFEKHLSSSLYKTNEDITQKKEPPLRNHEQRHQRTYIQKQINLSYDPLLPTSTGLFKLYIKHLKSGNVLSFILFLPTPHEDDR